MKNRRITTLIAAVLSLLLCLNLAASAAAEIAPLSGVASDYSKAENWIAQPEITKDVDTFYIYPTAYMPTGDDAPVYCEIDDARMRAIALNNFNTNCGAFSGSTNVFAPYYRQTSVQALQDFWGEEAEVVSRGVPRTDLYAALDYYFEHLNGGRPFIIAGHSQGSMMTRIILKEYMAAHPDYYARMIAAYPIGYSITQDDLDQYPWLRFAEGADDTGVIVSWNTEGPGNGESKLVLDGAISINPINWRRDDTYAPASENLGSLVNGELVNPGVADAQVDVNRGVVICTNEDFPYLDTSALASEPIFGTKSFHGNDYTFYYANIQKNVTDRIAAYRAKTAASAPSAEAVIDDFLSNFEALAAIPRQSKHEKAVSDYLKGWAEERGYTVRQNEVNDLFFDVPATEGYEALPLTALQAHLDMVCVAEEGRAFDPLTDPIRTIVDREAGTMTADGTTLGADDGAGVAMVMSIVKGNMAHGPLRVIFTTDEEVGMTGALAVTPEALAGVRYLINVDSEWSDTVTVSSAADARMVTTDTPRLTDARGDTAVSLTLSGLAGGHSGLMIGEGCCNAIIALAQTLTELGDALPFELVSLTGGIADNAIPSNAQAVIMIDAADREALAQFIADRQSALREDYAGTEDGLSLIAENADAAGKVLEQEQTERVLAYVTGAINGVYTMSEVIDGLVESSSNMGIINVDADGIEIRQMPRSSSAEKLADIEAHHRALAAENGLSIDITIGSRPWPAKADSVLVPMIQEIYKAQNGEEIKVEAVHAGLECGAFSELADGLDMVSIGPDVANAHSPEETLYLHSITKTWRLLEQILTSLP